MHELISYEDLTLIIDQINEEIINYNCATQNTAVYSSQDSAQCSSHTGHSSYDSKHYSKNGNNRHYASLQ